MPLVAHPPSANPPSFIAPCGRRQISEAPLHRAQWADSEHWLWRAEGSVAASLLPARAARHLTDLRSLRARDTGRRSCDGHTPFRMRTRRLSSDGYLRVVGNRNYRHVTWEYPQWERLTGPSRAEIARKDKDSAQCDRTRACSRPLRAIVCAFQAFRRLAVEARGTAPGGHHIHWRDERVHDSCKMDDPIFKSSPYDPILSSESKWRVGHNGEYRNQSDLRRCRKKSSRRT